MLCHVVMIHKIRIDRERRFCIIFYVIFFPACASRTMKDILKSVVFPLWLDLMHIIVPKRCIVWMMTDPISGAHDDVIKWKYFPRYWQFVRGIHRSPVNSPQKDQWRGALMFSLISARINGWENNREAGYLRRYRDHYDVTVMNPVNHDGSSI